MKVIDLETEEARDALESGASYLQARAFDLHLQSASPSQIGGELGFSTSRVEDFVDRGAEAYLFVPPTR